VRVNIDRAAPATTTHRNGMNVWLNGSDPLSFVSSTMYRIDGGVWKKYTGMITVTGNGTHLLEYYSIDAAGNQEATQTLEVKPSSGLSLGGMVAILLIGVVIAAAVIVVLLLLVKKRKQEQAPYQYVPPMQPPGPPQMPPQMPPQAPPQQ